MQAFNAELFLTTTDVADLLEVHPSTVKRWCDAGELETDRTDGGHRRIYLRNVLSFAQERGDETFLTPFAPFESHVWLAVRTAEVHDDFRRIHSLAMGWLVRGYPRRITALFAELASRPGVSFEHVCDRAIRPFMAEVGEEWHNGRLRIGDEHLAGQAVLEALFRMKPEGELEDPGALSGPAPLAGPVAVVGAAEGDQHQIGSMCVRVLLERRGWRVLYLGPNTPAEEFANVQRSQRASLACISLTPPAPAGQLRRSIDVLSEFYRSEAPYHLAFGGSAAGPAGEGSASEPPGSTSNDPANRRGPFLTLDCFDEMAAFGAWLDTIERGSDSSVTDHHLPGDEAWRGTGTE
jgi:MerR family transcriptional regulator, light-induced transcriptional regulator